MFTSTPFLKPRRSRLTWVLGSISIALIALVALVVAASALSGYGLNVRAFASAVASTLRAVRNQAAITASAGDYKNIIFLHHSVGQNMIAQGSVRELLAQEGYRFWDHDYNWPGLSDAAGKLVGYNYNIPGDNTDPDGLIGIFSQPLFDLPLNTLSGLMQHEVIAFKSCFPASAIASDEQLAQHQAWYLEIRNFMDQHPEKMFLVITQPPLNPAETSAGAATRARAFANWLKSDMFLGERRNVATFDLFDLLAENNLQAADANMLRQDYRQGGDSHPTQAANAIVGPQFAEFIINAVEQYKQARP
jgi:hypothetical protein